MDLFNEKMIANLRRENDSLRSLNEAANRKIERLQTERAEMIAGMIKTEVRSTYPETLAGSAGRPGSGGRVDITTTKARPAPKTADDHRTRAAEIIEHAFERNPFYAGYDQREHRNQLMDRAEQHIRAAKALDACKGIKS